MEEKQNPNILLVHIEHSKPIEINEFAQSLNAIGNLFSSYAQNKGENKELSRAKLYVEKIEQGSIDIFLKEIVTAGLIPFAENMNIILDFSSYLKSVFEYFTKGKGKEPDLGIAEAKNLRDLLNVVTGDNQGEIHIGAIDNGDKRNVLNNCVINFFDGNSAQNQIDKKIAKMKEVRPDEEVYARQLMTIYQVRKGTGSTGNKGIIESISDRKLGLVFDTDELENEILHSEQNPTLKGYVVDVIVQTAQGRPAAYKIMALHDVIDLD